MLVGGSASPAFKETRILYRYTRTTSRSLLHDAMLRTNAAAEELGIRLMLVHAKHERASRWYRRFGFEESPTDPLHLMLVTKDLRAYLSAAE